MGAFSNLGLGAAQPADKRPGFGSMRSESRFKGLMAKDAQDPGFRDSDEKPSLTKLTESSEAEAENRTGLSLEPRASMGANHSAENDLPTGSAALGGGLDASPPRNKSGFFGLGTPVKQSSGDESGFSVFGMTADTAAFRDSMQGRTDFAQQTPHQRSAEAANEPMSPTDTNPYQSPDHEKREQDEDELDAFNARNRPSTFGIDQGASTLPGLGGLGPMRGPGGPFDYGAGDRSQTSSTGPAKGFPGLAGLGGLPGLGSAAAWSNQPGGIGTPSQDRKFGEAYSEGPFGDLQSPSLAGLGTNAPFSGLGATGTLGRGSKMGSLFPAAMQEQMRAAESRGPLDDPSGDNAFSAFGRGPFSGVPTSGTPARDTESPFRANIGVLDEALAARSPFGLGSADFGKPSMQMSSASIQTPITAPTGQGPIGQHGPNRQSASSSASNQPPALQQRTMVMPDRMRWVYKDPQGNQQGPWTGLEMHEWYRGGFFSPDLQVKKEEDTEFEPLAHLIRRIGNSREPFLVPQIGIPHGPPTSQPGNAWAGGVIGPTSTGAQPPFAGSFPSFGTTLTAEQQNALERRKQEEQYLMARQKEHLAQQQMMAKQQMMHGMGPNLHHHGSAHSLHSQPSYGSITSPGGFQQSPAQPLPATSGMPGFFDNSFRGQQSSMGSELSQIQSARDEELPGFMERLNMRANQGSVGSSSQFPFQQQQQASDAFSQQVMAAQGDRARLQREQKEFDAMQQRLGNDQLAEQESAQRLQEFHDLRAAGEEEEDLDMNRFAQEQLLQQHDDALSAQLDDGSPMQPQREMSLTEQVQRTQSEKQQRQREEHKPQAWASKIDTSIPVQPFPPPTSSSPMPAPIAQRKQNLADQLNAESRSQTQTPSLDTPSASIAPWAKEANEQQSKGPSLKEIQEAEAKKAAEREALEVAARRAQVEKEMLAAAAAAAQQPLPGLPSAATWASGATGGSPSSATGPSAWVKPLAGKTTQATGSPAKKTLQQIQKEEEARKQRAIAAAAANSVASPTLIGPGGKRYADLASKAAAPNAAAPTATGTAWTTVGAGGKPKAPPIPTGPAPVTRSVSGPALTTKPIATVAKIGTPVKDKLNAQEEFRKWIVGELKGDLQKGVSGK